MPAESLSLRRQVTIKAIVTETFKQQAAAELQQALQQLDLQLEQLEFQGKRALQDLEKKGISPAGPQLTQQMEGLKEQIGEERNRLMSAKNDLLQRLNMISSLEPDSEFVQGQVDNFVEVSVGDNLYAKMAAPDIILKDGIVTEIRTVEG
ncbi:MAG TPA: YlqD family protein [Chroococcales cyanobacterium]